jgi:DNA helicase-2/ATP-dependent DNA helicase PcrA
MITLGIPYRVIGGLRFYERAEIRDAMAYMRVLHQPSDDLAFERIVNVPKRGLGDAALRALHETARRDSVPLAIAADRLAQSDALKGRPRAALAQLLRDFERWRAMLDREGHVATVAAMLDESGYTEMWRQDKSPEAPGRLDNLRELLRAIADFETLAGFLEHVALVMENDEAAEGDRVSLMTLHAAKGLEFDTVFLPGWEEGLFPNQRALDEGGAKALEEERRLAYVGLTRARSRAVVSWAANRRIYANWQSCIPSRFLAELPEEHVARATAPSVAMRVTAGAGSVFPAIGFGGAGRGRVIEAGAWEVEPRPARSERFARGDRVFHQKFGYGTVERVDDDKLDVAFPTGVKRILDRFVEKA